MRNILTGIICGLWCSSFSPAAAQEDETASSEQQAQAAIETIQAALDTANSGRYLEALHMLESAQDVPDAFVASFTQGVGTYRAFVGDETGAIDAFRLLGYSEEEFDPEILMHPLEARNAIDTIRAAATGHRVVMINEAHNVSRNRAFTTELISALHEDGFTIFAAEGFHPETASQMAEFGYPQHGMSAYIQDPFFAGMMREAHRLGMTLAYYEEQPDQSCLPECSVTERARGRELNQARNLAAVVEENPDARIIVHVGYAHLAETENDDSTRLLMGAHFARLTGLDPLTIDQFRGTSRVMPSHDQEMAFLSENYPVTEPTIYFEANGAPYKLADYADLTVIHPTLPDIYGRPGWIGMNGYRHPYQISSSELPEVRPIVLMAHVESEPDEAIPIDQLIVEEADTGPTTLMLPFGRYRLSAQQLDGPDIELGMIEVASE
ncbi:MAG: hypothetical protein GC188_03640 [Alphaproteobacteria bacterium]|nr:hypothetical protein [Alphaproteobacteria bacterium]